MSTDYYELLEVSRTRHGRGDQEVVPPAGPRAPSRRQPRRRRGRGQVQGDRQGLRGAVRPRAARPLRPVRRRRRHQLRRPVRPGRQGGLGDLFDAFFGGSGPFGGGGGARPGPARRVVPDLEVRRHARVHRGRVRLPDRSDGAHRGQRATRAPAVGRGDGHRRRSDLPRLRRHRASSAWCARRCSARSSRPPCAGAASGQGQIVDDPCAECSRRRSRSSPTRPTPSTCPPGSTPARRCASPGAARSGRGAVRRVTCT